MADFRAPSSAAVTGSSDGFERFSPEIQRVAQKRLAIAAIVYGGLWVVLYGLNFAQYWAAAGDARIVGERWFFFTIVAVVASATVLLMVRYVKLTSTAFTRLAATFQIIGALIIVVPNWDWQHCLARDLESLEVTVPMLEEAQRLRLEAATTSDAPPNRLFGHEGVHPVISWLLLFPLLVPLRPRKAAFLAFLTASTVPAVSLISVWLTGIPDIVRPVAGGYLFDMIAPVYAIAAGAVFASHVVYTLTRDLSKAQELGSYRLLEKIGAGGMGEVWKAQHRMLARPAAVKLIRERQGESSSAASETAIRRFEREAQATAALASPHTIDVYDFGTTDDGTFYYVMEYLDGVDLKTLVEKYGPVPASRVVHILRQATHSLWDAHQSGLVHRDIKPANLFITQRGPDFDFVTVLDFGLVKDLDGFGAGETQLTMEGVASGTPAFMAPEAATGEGSDARADLYALGCVAFWLLTGQLVFEDQSVIGLLRKHAKDEPAAPSSLSELDVPPALDSLVLRLLAKSPEDRPESAEVLLRELEAMEIEEWSRDQANRWWRMHGPVTAAAPATPPADGATSGPPSTP